MKTLTKQAESALRRADTDYASIDLEGLPDVPTLDRIATELPPLDNVPSLSAHELAQLASAYNLPADASKEHILQAAVPSFPATADLEPTASMPPVAATNVRGTPQTSPRQKSDRTLTPRSGLFSAQQLSIAAASADTHIATPVVSDVPRSAVASPQAAAAAARVEALAASPSGVMHVLPTASPLPPPRDPAVLAAEAVSRSFPRTFRVATAVVASFDTPCFSHLAPAAPSTDASCADSLCRLRSSGSRDPPSNPHAEFARLLDQVSRTLPDLVKQRKLVYFSEDKRPAFFGTFSHRSALITPLAPLTRDRTSRLADEVRPPSPEALSEVSNSDAVGGLFPPPPRALPPAAPGCAPAGTALAIDIEYSFETADEWSDVGDAEDLDKAEAAEASDGQQSDDSCIVPDDYISELEEVTREEDSDSVVLDVFADEAVAAAEIAIRARGMRGPDGLEDLDISESDNLAANNRPGSCSLAGAKRLRRQDLAEPAAKRPHRRIEPAPRSLGDTAPPEVVSRLRLPWDRPDLAAVAARASQIAAVSHWSISLATTAWSQALAAVPVPTPPTPASPSSALPLPSILVPAPRLVAPWDQPLLLQMPLSTTILPSRAKAAAEVAAAEVPDLAAVEEAKRILGAELTPAELLELGQGPPTLLM
jgi:hypothetical protein